MINLVKPALSISFGTRCNDSEYMSDHIRHSTVTEEAVFPNAIKRVTEYKPFALLRCIARIEHDRHIRSEQPLRNVSKIG